MLVPLLKGELAQAGASTPNICECRVGALPSADPDVFARQLARTLSSPTADRGGGDDPIRSLGSSGPASLGRAAYRGAGHMHDRELAQRLTAHDESAFREVVARYGGRLSRLARCFSRNDAVVEEAVQETWLAVIRGVHAFEGRSPLRTWIFGILVNQARRLAVREHREGQVAAGGVPTAGDVSDRDAAEDREPGMGPNGMWVERPTPWGLQNPEAFVLSAETLRVVETAIAELPESQRQVVLLRDVEGLEAAEVCNILGCADTHQRVLLHRGRARVRRALDRYMKEGITGRGAPRGKRTKR